MPSIPDEFVPLQPVSPIANPGAPQEDPGLGDILSATGTLFNWPYRSARHMLNRGDNPTDLDHDPFAMIKGTKYEADPDRFAYSHNERETRAIMSEWDADETAKDTYARSGWTGTVAGVGMGLLDPTIFLPVAKVFTGAKAGLTALRLAGDTALAGATGAAISEYMMAQTTDTTATDAAINIGTATVLSGLIGGGAGALLSRAEKNALTDALHADREDWGGYIARPGDANAAVADTRKLELNYNSTLAKFPDLTAKVSPPRRVLNSGFLSARRTVADLVETPYIFKENVDGIATTQGPALSRLAQLERDKAKVATSQMFDSLYARYRFGREAENLGERVTQMGSRLKDMASNTSGKADFMGFKSMVDEALRSGDQHAIPEVAEAAQFIRKNVLVPWRDRAIKAGMLPEDVDVKTADSYFMRMWNKEKLVADRPGVQKLFADWLEREEGKKLSIRETLGGHSERLASLNADIEKARAKLAKKADGDLDIQVGKLTAERDKLRADIEDGIRQWEGNSAKEAKAALKAREAAEKARSEAQAAGTYKGKGERLSSADAAIEKTVKRILARQPVARMEHDARANEIIDRIVGSPDGRLPYDDPSTSAPAGIARDEQMRGPLANREFAIPDALIRDYLETDSQMVVDVFMRSIVPDVLLTERFGDIRMTEAFRKINEESSARALAAKSDKERTAIEAERQAVETDLAAMRDRIRGTYGFSSDPRQRFLGRIAATAARYDIITNLGGAALSSLADMAGAQWRYGFTRTFKNAWAPMFRSLTNPETRKALKAYGHQLRALGIAAETYTATRMNGLHDVLDVYKPTSRFERATSMMADKFGLASLLTPWTDFGKFAAGMVSGGEITRAVEAISTGKATKRQIRDLAESGIDDVMAGRIWEQLQAPGGSDVIDGIRIPNTGAWADKKAAEAFEGMLARDVDLMVITPGAEKPLIMAKPIAALILQYKTFVASANERILVRSFQARDAQVLQGAVSAIGLGIISEYAYSLIADRDPPDNAADLIKAGVIRSGMLGFYQEGNSILAKWTGGEADAFRLMGATRPDARYISRSPGAALLGPVYGKFEAAVKSFSKVAAMSLGGDQEWTESDTRGLRRLLIGQNLFWLRNLLDKGEEGVNDVLGVQ